MAVNNSTTGQLHDIQNLIGGFVAMLDGEAAIPEADRLLTQANIDDINVNISDLLEQFNDIANAVPAP